MAKSREQGRAGERKLGPAGPCGFRGEGLRADVERDGRRGAGHMELLGGGCGRRGFGISTSLIAIYAKD